MSSEQKPVVGISCGDLNGIGMEVIMKTFGNSTMLELCTPVLFASSKVVSYHRKALEMEEFNYQSIASLDKINPKKMNLYNCWNDQVNLEFGINSKEVGSFALRSLDSAIEAWQNKHIDAIVTAPINKNNIELPDRSFTGHTGYLGEQTEGDPLMILMTDHLRIALVTGHVPVSEIAAGITKESIIAKIKSLHKSLKEDFGIRKPKIGVLGLNPHAGDDGLLGKEEIDIIEPAISDCFKEGILAYGPYPSDGYFGADTFKKFDATLAMYHDQGLIPFKTLAFEDGVNYTAGLNMVRTSPDHGTGFDIAGKNKASEVSFRNAVYAAIQIIEQRNMHAEINKNPLQKQEIQRNSNK